MKDLIKIGKMFVDGTNLSDGGDSSPSSFAGGDSSCSSSLGVSSRRRLASFAARRASFSFKRRSYKNHP
jgi:hypothetical protein